MINQTFGYLIILFLIQYVSAQRGLYAQSKVMEFQDPNTGYLYKVISYDVKTAYRSVIQVSKAKVDGGQVGKPENVQTIKFTPRLVDFDIHCSPKFCYMVTVTSKSKLNVELFGWQRTQFDQLSRRDSFSKPAAITLFTIGDEFYVAIAQDQLHLSRKKAAYEYDEPTRFIGCAILKFSKGSEDKIKYHQFIRLPFNPQHVSHMTQENSSAPERANQDHFLAFSEGPVLQEQEQRLSPSRIFIWSPLDGLFWPYRMPRGIKITQIPKPASSGFLVQFPKEPPRFDSKAQPLDYTEATEGCFHHLHKLLADRDLRSRRLIESSRSVWRRMSRVSDQIPYSNSLTNISSQVIVHGNVTVRGSLIESPQVSVLGSSGFPKVRLSPVSAFNLDVLRKFSPAHVDKKLAQAYMKLKYMRDKLSHAVYANLPDFPSSTFFSQIQLFGNILAKEVILRGVENHDVMINGVPFNQLANELVSLRGSQTVYPQVQFRGRVVADMLEVHGSINGRYRLKDAIDITSRFPQILELPETSRGVLDFHLISTPEVKVVSNATINEIRLSEFITRDNRTQIVYGRKMFARLSADRLDLSNQGITLNNRNLSQLSMSAIRLRDPNNSPRILRGHGIFSRPIFVQKLVVNNVINQHINISLLIQDSVKTVDPNIQQIIGFKNFLNGVKINNLNTKGAINGVQIDKIFNLNAESPYWGQGHHEQMITGNYRLMSNVDIIGNLTARTVNGIDLGSRAIRRAPRGQVSLEPMVVRGVKTFLKPLRVIDNVTLLDAPQMDRLKQSNISVLYPLIDGIDLRKISANLARQMQTPALIFIDNLEIEGNVDLPSYLNETAPFQRVTFGNNIYCPLDSIKSKLITSGLEDQAISIPTRVGTLRAKAVQLGPGALNGFNFPQDFVMRNSDGLEPVYGAKRLHHLTIPSSMLPGNKHLRDSRAQLVLLGSGANINNLDYGELQTFVLHEGKRNSTGEQVFNTINVHGNINAKRINGHSWPDDILLKNLGTVSGPPESPYVHNRIYSPLIFTNSSYLDVKGQLVLRGPVKLGGRLNGVNLTEFSRQSATYGDKDLLYKGRPLNNKLFLGGIAVHGELRSQGLLDGVNIDDMRRRVVTVGPRGTRVSINGPKMFMSDTHARAPINILYLNDLPINNYLDRLHFEPDGHTIRISNKKIITGALRINKDLLVDGVINGVDYSSLRTQAISLSQPADQLVFNKSFYIEGEAYIDDLHIDEKNGTLDGVKLRDMVPRVILNQPDSTNHQAMFDSGQPLVYPPSLPPVYLNPRQPISVHYEPDRSKGQLMNRPNRRFGRSVAQTDQLILLKNQMVPDNLINFNSFIDIVIGFIDSQFQTLEGYELPDGPALHSDHLTDDLRQFAVLDQIDFSYKVDHNSFNPVTYHLSVVVSREPATGNVTSVHSSIGGRPHQLMSVLPVEFPNGAIFISDANDEALFLIISQDYTVKLNSRSICPLSDRIPPSVYQRSLETSRVHGNLHVYLFHVLHNSSSPRSAYFDLYQTIDLPEVDSFTNFYYRGSTYVLAASRATSRIYLMILRGFSGFQLVSHIDAPLLDHVEIVYASDDRPAIVIYHQNGSYKIMESVLI